MRLKGFSVAMSEDIDVSPRHVTFILVAPIDHKRLPSLPSASQLPLIPFLLELFYI
jgi:hypothetical protein